MCTQTHMFWNTCVCEGTLYCSFFVFLIYRFYSCLVLIFLLSIYMLVCMFAFVVLLF